LVSDSLDRLRGTLQGQYAISYSGAHNENLAARKFLRAGMYEGPDILERLLKTFPHLSPGWLRIAPSWKALRGNPRFERLNARQ
jgi:hypothetical protein